MTNSALSLGGAASRCAALRAAALRCDYQLDRDFALTDWLTVISRYFGGNPDEGSDFISKGFVASAIF